MRRLSLVRGVKGVCTSSSLSRPPYDIQTPNDSARSVNLARVETLERRLLMAAGDLDSAFGTGGKVTTALPLGSRDDAAAAILAVSGGKFVAAGTSSGDFALAKYNSNGSIDTGFGVGGTEGSGLVLTDFGRYERAAAAAVLGDGKLLVAGTSAKGDPGALRGENGGVVGPDGDLVLARYNTNGTLDTAFSGDGKVTTNLGLNETAAAMAVLSDGKILVAGTRQTGSGAEANDEQMLLVRYNANGSLDTTFGGGDGWATVNLIDGFGFAGDRARAVTVLSSGKVVVAGAGGIARFNSNGSLDTTFRGTGKLQLTGFTDGFFTLLPLAGDTFVATEVTFRNPDASPFEDDTLHLREFGANGSVVRTASTKLGGDQVIRPTRMVRLASGKFLLAARVFSQLGPSPTVVNDLVRFNSNLTLDTTYGGGTGQINREGTDAGALIALSGDKVMTAGAAGADRGLPLDFGVARHNADGSLDATFGPGGADGNGVVTTDFRDPTGAASRARGRAVTIDPSGKVIVLGQSGGMFGAAQGNPVLLRYNPDGALDASFGSAGVAPVPTQGLSGFIMALTTQPDSKILAVTQDGISRFNADGSLDLTFSAGDGDVAGQNSRIPTDASDVLVLPDGKILVGGTGTGPRFLLMRYNADGTRDMTFGDAGVVETYFSEPTEFRTNILSLALDAGGKIVAAGTGGPDGSIGVARYLPDGSHDATFGPGSPEGVGRVRIGPAGLESFSVRGATDVLVLPGSKVVVSAGSGLVIQLNADGSIDNSFGGGDGMATLSFGGNLFQPLALGLAAGGKILVGGPTTGFDNFKVTRLNPNGSVDNSFDNGDGSVTTDFGGTRDEIGVHALALTPDGSIVVAGSAVSTGDSSSRVAIARYRGDVPPGVIRIDGTTGNDKISLTQSGSTLSINRNGTISTRSLTGVNRLFVYGLDGDDTLSVADSVLVGATLVGGRGNDSLRGGSRADDLFGGEGTDTADYSAATLALSISIDERANDGPGGQDNVRNDVEILLGGAGNDTLTGSTSYNVLVGNGGDDTLRGGGSRDVLIGGHGKDSLFGDEFDDLLIASRTTFDGNLPFLRTMSLEWRNTSRSYTDRVARLRAGVNGVKIDASTAPNDNVVDSLTGGPGRDWFVFHSGDIRIDRAADETATQL